MKKMGYDTSYVETSFGAPTSIERAGIAAKDLFPKMSSSESSRASANLAGSR